MRSPQGSFGAPKGSSKLQGAPIGAPKGIKGSLGGLRDPQ